MELSQVKNNIYKLKDLIFIATVQPCLFILQQFFTSHFWLALCFFFKCVWNELVWCSVAKQASSESQMFTKSKWCEHPSEWAKMFSFLNNRKYILRSYCLPCLVWLETVHELRFQKQQPQRPKIKLCDTSPTIHTFL